MTKLIDTVAAAIIWIFRHQADVERVLAVLFEGLGFWLIAVLVANVAGDAWALIPIAAYLLLQSVSLTRRAGSPRGGR